LFAEKSYSEKIRIVYVDSCGNELRSTEAEFTYKNESGPNPILQIFNKKRERTKKLTAALLAFPFPFGIVGLHRIYLGTKPYVPVAYIASLGGVFGILPLIDFFVILFDKDFEHYENNGKVFMWIRD
jgi:TM2 domain-containing membrane protein YozV